MPEDDLPEVSMSTTDPIGNNRGSAATIPVRVRVPDAVPPS
jgi:hypothetical protein